MNTSRIKMSHPLGQTPPNTFTDFDWIHQNKKELIEKYGECDVIVYKEQVLGVGSSYAEALENAERDLPPGMGEVTPVHQWIGRRHPFLRAYPVPKRKDNNVLRIEGKGSCHIDFDFEKLDSANTPSIAFGIEVESGEFRAYENEIWFYLSNLENFAAQLEIIEAKRQGEARLKQLTYTEEDSPFQLRIFSIDNRGHFALSVSMQHTHHLGDNHKLFNNRISITFELDPTTLRKILSDFKNVLAQQNNSKNTTE